MHAFDLLAGEMLTRLAWTSLQAALLVGLIALLLRLRPTLPATTRCAIWWLVSLQVLVGLATPTPIELPWLTPATTTVSSQPVVTIGASTEVMPAAPVATLEEQAAPTPITAWIPAWPRGLLALWLAGVLAQIPFLVRDARGTRRLRREADQADEALQKLCRQMSASMQLRRVPQIRTSLNIRSPQIVALLQPTILWPVDAALSQPQIAMAMAHELAHLKRGDLWLGWVPAIARRLFFFHPLIALAVREYALQREAACDAQVLQQRNFDPRAYGQLLLHLGVDRALPAGLAGASPTFGNLKRRLIMLQPSKPLTRLHTWLLIGAIAAVGVVPYRVTAADQAAHINPPSATTQTPAHPVPPVPPPPAPPVPPVPPPPPPALPHPSPPPAPPVLPAGLNTLQHVDIDTHNHAGRGFALIDNDSATIRGSSEDVAAAGRLHSKSGGSLLWVRRGDNGYVIRDPAVLAQAHQIQAPLTQLIREQGKLAGRQGEIAGHESGIAAREEGFANERAALAERRAELASRLANSGRPQALADYARKQQALNAEQNRIDARYQAMQRDLVLQRQDLSKQRSDIAGQMSALNERSKQMTASNREAMDTLVADAIKHGKTEKISLP